VSVGSAGSPGHGRLLCRGVAAAAQERVLTGLGAPSVVLGALRALSNTTRTRYAVRLTCGRLALPMNIELSLITELSELQALADEWRGLAEAGGSGGLFRGPDWLIPWWHAYHQVLHAELHVLAGRAGGQLVCLAPLYKREARSTPGVK